MTSSFLKHLSSPEKFTLKEQGPEGTSPQTLTFAVHPTETPSLPIGKKVSVKKLAEGSDDEGNQPTSSEITLIPLDHHRGTAIIDGRQVPYAVCWENNTHQGASEDTLVLWVDGQIYRFERPSISPRRGRKAGGSKGDVEGSGRLVAPMPGKVLKLLVKPGASVEAKATLVVMESMKMEMSLNAPRSGVVKLVNATEGQMVEQGTLLIELEPLPENTSESSASAKGN